MGIKKCNYHPSWEVGHSWLQEHKSEILETVHAWSRKWRMVINCNRNKSEVIAFATAENDRNLVPKPFKIGDNEIKIFSKTTVL